MINKLSENKIKKLKRESIKLSLFKKKKKKNYMLIQY